MASPRPREGVESNDRRAAIQRVTRPTLAVLVALLDHPSHKWYGLELCKQTGLAGGSLYPILARLEQNDWLASQWEEPERQETERRPRRRYYWLTEKGRSEAWWIVWRKSGGTVQLKPEPLS
jgi:PadR family transcriptional regulator PadR